MEIRPFKAFRFDEKAVGDVGRCVAPPYDVINGEQQDRLYEKSEYNIVRIINGKTGPSDNENDNQYTRAAEHFRSWIEKGVLKQDSADTIYAYVQDFQLGGADFQRLSFIALAKLEEFGKIVKPHEQILKEPTIDRLNLKKATDARFGLVFMLYEDPKHVADNIVEKTAQQKPLVDFVDDFNVRHRLFFITDQNDISAVTEMMRDKSCVIADGHHRYTTDLMYAKETNDPAARFPMIAFCNVCHEGLLVLATHRLVGNLNGFDIDKLLAALQTDFDLMRYTFNSDRTKTDARENMLAQIRVEHCKDGNAFGIYAGDNAFHVAVLRDKRKMDSVAPDMSTHYRSLDVAVLHKLVLEKLLNIDEQALAGGTNIVYVKDGDHATDRMIEQIDQKSKQVAFFMNPPKISQIQMVADAGERMPQKSTYFYPKVHSGLTINKI